MMISSVIFSICAACLTPVIVSGCHLRTVSPSGSNDTKSDPMQSQSNKRSDLVSSGVFDNNPIVLKAWLKFIEGGKYRAANAEDFKFSEAAKSKLWRMFEGGWHDRIDHPAITGNLNRRHGFKDLAIIVVDTEEKEPARFGVVIFNREPDNEQVASVHWLVRSRDLSTAMLSWHSNWPVMVFYDEDGSADPYYINWNENTRTYFLDKRQVGPDARPGRLREKSAETNISSRKTPNIGLVKQ